MTIGLFPFSTAARLVPRIPATSLGVRFVAAASSGELSGIDLLHLFGTGAECLALARAAREQRIPVAVSPLLSVRPAPWVARTIAAAPALSGLLTRPRVEGFAAARTLCAEAALVLPRSAREARILQHGLGVPEGKIRIVPPAVDPRYLSYGDSEFSLPGRFILADGIDGEPERNLLLLIQALEKINHPALLLASSGRSADAYRAAAAGNPRLRIVDDVAADSDRYVAAVRGAEVVVDVAFDQRGASAVNAAAAGAKIVVSKTAGWEELLGVHAEYVEPTSWELMHHGITSALNAPSENHTIRDHVRNACSAERVLASLERAYQSAK
jgi:glycosyltransferase involved in cell wall biosynthesis